MSAVAQAHPRPRCEPSDLTLSVTGEVYLGGWLLGTWHIERFRGWSAYVGWWAPVRHFESKAELRAWFAEQVQLPLRAVP